MWAKIRIVVQQPRVCSTKAVLILEVLVESLAARKAHIGRCCMHEIGLEGVEGIGLEAQLHEGRKSALVGGVEAWK